MPLRTELKNGDRVEIITAAHAKPNPGWLNYVVTGKARSHIRHFLRTMRFQESVQLGERLLNQALGTLGTNLGTIGEGPWERMLKETAAKSSEEILADIGLGKRLAAVVARQLFAHAGGDSEFPEARPAGPVVIRGSEGMAVQLAACCQPIPGDPIMGLITKGHGMVVHAHDCPVLAKMRLDPEKILDIEWDPDTKKTFDVNINIVAANQRGVLARIAAGIAESGSNIENVAMDPQDGSQYTAMHFTLAVKNRLHLASILRGLRRVPEVIRIARVKG
jgi:GTP pyrophosphokinase